MADAGDGSCIVEPYYCSGGEADPSLRPCSGGLAGYKTPMRSHLVSQDTEAEVPELTETIGEGSDEDTSGREAPADLFRSEGVTTETNEWFENESTPSPSKAHPHSATGDCGANANNQDYVSPSVDHVSPSGDHVSPSEHHVSPSGDHVPPSGDRESIASITSLRYMRSGLRQDGRMTPSSLNDKDLPNFLLAPSPQGRLSLLRLSSPTKGLFLGQSPGSDTSNHRTSLPRFASDDWQILSPGKAYLSPARSPPRSPPRQNTSPNRREPSFNLPPVREEYSDAAAAAAAAVAAHPGLFGRPEERQQPSLQHLQSDLELQDALHKEQRLREELESDLQKKTTLCEQLESILILRQEEHSLLNHLREEQKGIMARRQASEEHFEQVKTELMQREEALRKKEEACCEREREIERELMRMDMERDHLDEERGNFVIQHVASKSDRMIKRERDLCAKRDELHSFEKELKEKERIIDAHNARRDCFERNLQSDKEKLEADIENFHTRQLLLEERERELDDRQLVLDDRERQLEEDRARHLAETRDRASQTPVFRQSTARRSCWCRFFWYSVSLSAIVVMIVVFVTYRPSSIDKVHSWARGWISSLKGVAERLGVDSLQSVKDLPKLWQRQLSSMCTSSPPEQPACAFRASTHHWQNGSTMVPSSSSWLTEPQAARMTQWSSQMLGGLCGIVFWYGAP